MNSGLPEECPIAGTGAPFRPAAAAGASCFYQDFSA